MLSYVRFSIDDPHSIGRVECDGKEDGIRVGFFSNENERCLSQKLRGQQSNAAGQRDNALFAVVLKDELRLYPSRANSVIRLMRKYL